MCMSVFPLYWDVTYVTEKHFSFMRALCSIVGVGINCWANGVPFRNSFPLPLYWKVLHTFCLTSFIILVQTLWSLIQLKFILDMVIKKVCNYMVLCVGVYIFWNYWWRCCFVQFVFGIIVICQMFIVIVLIFRAFLVSLICLVPVSLYFITMSLQYF